MTAADDLVHVFGRHAANTTYESLPSEAVEAARKSVLDTLGVILAASGLEPAARSVFEIVAEMGGGGDATLLGYGGRAPAVMAAFANGALAHCLDYDDQTPWGQHCASTIVPAAFALAERDGAVCGRELLTAVAVGQDIFARLRTHVGWGKDWNLSTVLAVFAGTAAGARVAKLPTHSATNAIGIASMQSSGIMEMVAGRGSDLRGLYAAFSAKGAVLATLMAQKGIGGIDRMFEGEYGFFNTYFGGRYDREGLVAGLGEDFLGAGTLYKRWPCVGTAHSHMKAAIDIVSDNDLAPDEIAAIRLHVGDYHELMCVPLAERRSPATLADAKFSLPFLVALAIERRGMAVTDFTPETLFDPSIQRTAGKIALVAAPELDWKLELPPGRVEIVTRNGRRWLREGRAVPGNADNPMGWDDVAAKFAECATVARSPVAGSSVARAVALVRDIEKLDDVGIIMRELG